MMKGALDADQEVARVLAPYKSGARLKNIGTKSITSMDNPYCITGTDILKNKLGIEDASELKLIEEAVTLTQMAKLRNILLTENLTISI